MEKPDNSSSKQGAESEVRYSESFLREQKSKEKKSLLLGGFLCLFVAGGIFYETLRAYQMHTWVDIGSHAMNHVMVPPIIGVLVGLGVAALSLFCFWQRFSK